MKPSVRQARRRVAAVHRARSVVLGLAWLAWLPGPVAADWLVARGNDRGLPQTRQVASAVNATGHRVDVYRAGSGEIRIRLVLTEGFGTLRRDACVTFQIDATTTLAHDLDAGVCRSQARWGEIVIGRITAGRVVSAPLYALLNGTSLVCRYAGASGGYRETSFSLAQSKRAILAAIGRDLAIEAP